MFSRRLRFFAAVLVVVMAAGCSGESKPGASSPSSDVSSNKGETPTEPVTLNFYTEGNASVLADTIAELVAKKYPHIKLNTTLGKGKAQIEDMVGAGQCRIASGFPRIRGKRLPV
ncbi:hypothetical protein PV433_20640 [Paenibacillus sp. GYB004]|uniref:hypothetical protein n=1 Tax=Paenibacillus sp. GYB004 TaxID=2994393 RepID=UPI002F969BF2